MRRLLEMHERLRIGQDRRRRHRARAHPGHAHGFRIRTGDVPPMRRSEMRHGMPCRRARQERRKRRDRMGRRQMRRLPALHRGLRLRRHRARCGGRTGRQMRYVRRRAGLRVGLSDRGAAPRHVRAHLQRGRRLGGHVRARTRRLPGLQHRTLDAPHHAPRRSRCRAGDAAGLRAGHGFGRLQRPHRHQGSGLSPAADQHRRDAGGRQTPAQAQRPRGHRDGDRRRRRRIRRRLPVALRAPPNAARKYCSWSSTTRAT